MIERLISHRKYLIYSLIGALLGILFTGILAPIYQNHVKENWELQLQERINSIEAEVTAEFQQMHEQLKRTALVYKDSLGQFLLQPDFEKKFPGFSIDAVNKQRHETIITDEQGNLLSWSNSPLVNEKMYINQNFQPGEIYFFDSALITYLSVYDTLSIRDQDYIVALYIPVYKKYKVENYYYEKLDPSERLSEKFQTDFKIKYGRAAQPSRDGRIYSFDILNNYNNKIGLVQFQKPARDTFLNRTEAAFNLIQSLFALLSTALFFLIMSTFLGKIPGRFLKFVFVGLIVAAFRYVLNLLDILRIFENWKIHNPKYFSSILGNGIVSSPLELFVSLIFFSALSFYGFKKSYDYFKEPNRRKNIFLIIPFILLTAVYFVSIRGYGSAIHSMIFDSNLKYFKGLTLLPEFPETFMLMNLLIFSFAAFILSAAFLLIIVSQLKRFVKIRLYAITALFLGFQLLGFLYGEVQQSPQVSHIIRVLFISAGFLFVWVTVRSKKKYYFYFVYALMASIISILALNFHNTQLEKESLKRTAYELTRQNESLLKFAVYETLVDAITSSEVVNLFTGENTNPDAAAFKLWSSSILNRESLGCSINFLDKDLNTTGGFKFRFNEAYEGDWKTHKSELNDLHDIKIVNENVYFSEDRIIRGIATIENVEGILGYVEVNVLYNISSIGLPNTPEFLITDQHYFNETVDYAELSIFDFHNGTLINSKSDYNLGENEIISILNAPFDSYNEAWINMEFGGESKLVFVVKVERENINRILAVALREKELSLNLFDFFKPFFVHSLVIVILLILFVLYRLYKVEKLRLNFSSKLLISFLFISLIPLILVAFFFRSLTAEKNNTAIEYKLEKRAASVEEYVKRYLNESALNEEQIFKKASIDLGIDYTLYLDDKFVYSTNHQYYNVGLIPKLINPAAKLALYRNGMNQKLLNENIENYRFQSLYYKTSILGVYHTIKVTDAFNKITIPLSGSEVDVYIFVSYSLAVIFIIIIGYILTNQLAQPLRELTTATKYVAQGDFGVKVYKRTNDEIGELVTGFNLMVDEIKRNQAEIAELERETAWKEMAKQVAHEIKNPLTPMKLSVQHLIASYRDNSEKFEEIFDKVTTTVIKQIETLKNIASEFSSFARMPNPKTEIVLLNKIIDEACNLFSDENLSIIKHYEKNIYIEADADQLRRVFINLIRNAIQADADKISVTINQTDSNIEIRLSDNGSGIPLELKDKIFESNFTTKKSGMGLGLTMAKRTIENHNGNITVESTSSNGSTILIILKAL